MQSAPRANLRLFITPTHLVLQSTATGTASQLVIDLKSHQCRNTRLFNPFDQDIRNSDVRMFEAFGFLGIVQVAQHWFAGVVTKTVRIGSLGNKEFFRVVKVVLVSLQQEETTIEERKVLESVTEVLEGGFFYSPTYDLTQSLQAQHELSPGSFLHSHASSKYYWNREMYKELSTQGVDQKWFLPLVQGFIGFRTLTFADQQAEYMLVSRRSCERAGTRYNARGVDDEGEVANFVETEQILVINDLWFSHTMVRGTVPVFWQQTGLSAHFELTRSPELTAPAFSQSISKLITAYEKVLMINLLSNSKPHERVLTDALRRQITLHKMKFEETLSYLEYDYKTETKDDQTKAEALVTRASPMLLCYLFFSIKDREILTRQKGVARVNCLDCLDRTNIVMCRLAWYMLRWELKTVDLQLDTTFDDPSDTNLSSFKALWVENGDVLSLQYTGAASTASFAPKSAASSLLGFFDHSVKSVERFYSATLTDNKKQDGIETLLGKHASAIAKSMRASALHRQVKSRELEYLEEEKARVRIVSWNVRGERPPPSEVIMNVLFANESEAADIFAIGLQDLVLVNATNLFQSTKNLAIVQAWTQLVSVAFTRYTKRKYLLLKSEVQVGLLSLVYVQSGLASSIKNFAVDKVKLGLGTALGGKGAIVVRFNLFHSSLCFAHVHLEGESADVETRLQQLETIENSAFQVETVGVRKGWSIKSHEAIFLYGDLNFKIGSSAYDILSYSKLRNMTMLLANDQLSAVMTEQKSPILAAYHEGSITFLPTVNRVEIEKETPDYQKPLAWTDRVLFSGKGVTQLSYEPVDVRVSSHLPIVSSFAVTLQKVNEEKRQRIEKEESAKPLSLDTAASDDSARLLFTSEPE